MHAGAGDHRAVQDYFEFSKVIRKMLFGPHDRSQRTANARDSPKEQYLVLPSKSSPRESPEGVCIMHATDIVEASKPAGANGFAQLTTFHETCVPSRFLVRFRPNFEKM